MINFIFIVVILHLLIILSVACAPTQGISGQNGYNALVETTRYEAGLPTCPTGSGLEVSAGVDQNRDNKLQIAEKININIICDGNDVPPSSYTITEIIDPCGAQAAYDEVLLRTLGGTLLGHYSNGQRQFLSVISDGTYKTTDGTKCEFVVKNGIVTWK